MQVKGLELPGYEPRGVKATGFGYATSSIGGSHGNGSLAFQEWGMPVPRAVDRFSRGGQGGHRDLQPERFGPRGVGIICSFSRSWGDWYRRIYPAMLKAATGIEEFGDMRYLGGVSERIVALERAFNVRQGVRRKKDRSSGSFSDRAAAHRGRRRGKAR